MHIAPVGHRVLVKKADVDDRDPVFRSARRAGIEIAKDHEDAKRREAGIDRGWVLEVGEDAFKSFWYNSNPTSPPEDFKPWVKPGDFIAFAKYGGMLIPDHDDPDTQYIVINDEDVVAILEEPK